MPLRRRQPLTQLLSKPGRAGGTIVLPESFSPATIVTPTMGDIELPEISTALEYEWKLYESMTGRYLGDLPVTYATYSHRRNAPGGGELHLPSSTRRTFGLDVEPFDLAGVEEYAHQLGIFRNDSLVWNGLIGRTRTNSIDARAAFALVGWWDYFRGRIVRPTFHHAGDMLDVIRMFVEHCQLNDASGNLGIMTDMMDDERALSGIFQELMINDYDFKYYGDIIEDLARGNDPFDFNITSFTDVDGMIMKELVLGAPRIGIRRPVHVEWGRNMFEYQWARDGSTRQTRTWGIGAGEGAQALIALRDDSASFGRVPMREGIIARKEIDWTQYARLVSITNAEQQSKTQPVETLNCTVYSGGAHDPIVGAFTVGDSIQATIDDGLTQIDKYMRVQSYAVSVQDNMEETVDIELAPETVT